MKAISVKGQDWMMKGISMKGHAARKEISIKGEAAKKEISMKGHAARK